MLDEKHNFNLFRNIKFITFFHFSILQVQSGMFYCNPTQHILSNGCWEEIWGFDCTVDVEQHRKILSSRVSKPTLCPSSVNSAGIRHKSAPFGIIDKCSYPACVNNDLQHTWLFNWFTDDLTIFTLYQVWSYYFHTLPGLVAIQTWLALKFTCQCIHPIDVEVSSHSYFYHFRSSQTSTTST